MIKNIIIYLNILCLILLINISIYGKERVYNFDYKKKIEIYANIDGEKGDEKIVFNNNIITNSNQETVFKTTIDIFEKGKKVFTYDGFREDYQIEYLKVVNFEGSTVSSNREIIFLMVSGCDCHIHMLHYKHDPIPNKHISIGKYIVSKFIAEIKKCY